MAGLYVHEPIGCKSVLNLFPHPLSIVEPLAAAGDAGFCLVDVPPDAAAALVLVAGVLGWQITPGEDVSLQIMAPGPNAAALPEPAVLRHAVAEIAGYAGRLAPDVVRGRLQMIMARAAAREAALPGVPAAIRADTDRDAVDLIARRHTHEGFFLTREDRLRHPYFNGAMSAEVTREVFIATDAAIVLPYDPLRDRVLLVEQFRMGPYGRGDPRPWMLEPVAGRVDAGETPEAAARRECEEEAGLVLKTLEKIAAYYCSPGCSTEYFHCYVGLCDLPDAGRGSGGLATEHEDIRTHVLVFDDAHALLASGEADNGPLILSLLWLAQARTRLRAEA